MFLARRTPGLNDLVLLAHERIQIVALYFFSDRFQQLRPFHGSTADLSIVLKTRFDVLWPYESQRKD
jgi:hypothetical protein